jgi:DNA-binding MarR family transcriptional regulator
MNEISTAINEELLRYQAQRLRDLIAEMLKCCEDRKLYESGRFGVPYAELKVLMLFDGERYLTVKGIAKKLEVAKSRVTRLIDGLRTRGLVEQIYDPKDARIKLISLTPEGQRKSKEIGAFQYELYRTILLQMDPEQRKNMLSYLELLRSAMEAVKEKLT